MSDEYEPEDPSHLIARAKLEAGLNEGAEGEYPTDLVEELVGVLEKTARENDALWDNLNERDGELSDMTARAEAAEAVIAAALEVEPVGLAHWKIRRILKSVPQTVLAERDRKNRREAWDEGVYATPYRGSDVDVETLARNPYTPAVSHPEPTEGVR